LSKTLENSLDRKISRAIYDYKLMEAGDRVLVAVSGGKDSMSLLYFLKKKCGRFPVPYELGALHVRTDFGGCLADPRMYAMAESWNITIETIDLPVVARLKEGQSMNCWWCASQRRIELMRYATEHGYNKIALGHHMDDIIQTLLMNMAYKGEMATMLPAMKYDRYPHTVIRPLALIKESDIADFAKLKDFFGWSVTCPFGTKSQRHDARAAIDALSKDKTPVRENIFRAIHNRNERYLPQKDDYPSKIKQHSSVSIDQVDDTTRDDF
jgi:tRNA 2-thiocytidine biosynthesis protein TtcA